MQQMAVPLAYMGMEVVIASEAVNSDSEESFQAFYRLRYRELVKALYFSTRNVQAAEESVQEAMAIAFDRWKRVRGMDSPAGYVYRVAANHYRRSLRRAQREQSIETVEPCDSHDLEAESIERLMLLDAITNLPRKQRDAVVLSDWMGVSQDDAAGTLKMKPATFRSNLYRGRKSLRINLVRGSDE